MTHAMHILIKSGAGNALIALTDLLLKKSYGKNLANTEGYTL